MASVSISCPSCSATDGVVRNGKSTAGHQRALLQIVGGDKLIIP
ncbi:TPA: IS1 family transposase, partial [Escherichia coli]